MIGWSACVGNGEATAKARMRDEILSFEVLSDDHSSLIWNWKNPSCGGTKSPNRLSSCSQAGGVIPHAHTWTSTSRMKTGLDVASTEHR